MKILADYIGVCWHEWKFEMGEPICKICLVQNGYRPNFTTGNGWQLIADKISENDDWGEFYSWYLCEKLNVGLKDLAALFSLAKFHELKPAEKSKIFAEYLEAKS